jgi:hypothetical protein
MPVITNIITAQSYEIIRDRIAYILFDEIQNQKIVQSNNDLDVTITTENKSPNDKTDLPLVTVSISSGDYSNKHQGSSDGVYTVFIDCYASSKTTNTNDGASLATIKLHKLIGIVRYILEDPQYKTLGYAVGGSNLPFILRTFVQNIAFKDIDNNDSYNIAMGRVTFLVTANESNKLLTPTIVINNNITTVNNIYTYRFTS